MPDPRILLNELERDLKAIRVFVKFSIHAKGIDVIGREYADRLIAAAELRKNKLPFFAHYPPPVAKLSRL